MLTIIIISNKMQFDYNHSTHMYVCICHGITDKDIQKAARSGINSINQLAAETGATTGCGSCLDMAQDILRQQSNQQADFLQVLSPNKPHFA